MTKKQQEVKNAWEYADWLYQSGRLTAEEHLKLKVFLVDLEDETRAAYECYCDEGC